VISTKIYVKLDRKNEKKEINTNDEIIRKKKSYYRIERNQPALTTKLSCVTTNPTGFNLFTQLDATNLNRVNSALNSLKISITLTADEVATGVSTLRKPSELLAVSDEFFPVSWFESLKIY
jgi:hypothetical protein